VERSLYPPDIKKQPPNFDRIPKKFMMALHDKDFAYLSSHFQSTLERRCTHSQLFFQRIVYLDGLYDPFDDLLNTITEETLHIHQLLRRYEAYLQ
jgi:hypothetical protein